MNLREEFEKETGNKCFDGAATHYVLWLEVKLQQPAKIPIGEVIKKWELILQLDKGKDIDYDRHVIEEILTDFKTQTK